MEIFGRPPEGKTRGGDNQQQLVNLEIRPVIGEKGAIERNSLEPVIRG